MELHKMIEQVDSKESFLEFVAALRSDWEARGREPEWENPDLGRFLEAMQSWTEDMDERVPATPSWRTFADMLYAAKIYE
jgi:hypothetical protein